ncbi:GNAT family N-acetyltransferase [Arthrobacter sp. NPDC090010]|uniref:GNAT family N-acetyltransferase n=1 Tax=Arthrobacter sp. NPDC090010 TaxID=3363942 RepID=UPI0037F53AAF
MARAAVPATVAYSRDMNGPGRELALRRVRLEDAPRIHEWASRPEASRYQAWGPHGYSDTVRFLQDALAAWDADPQRRWVFGAERGAELFGVGEIKWRSPSTFEISYSIHAQYWGQGLGTSLARLLVARVFSAHEDAERVQATCDPRNVASERTLQRIGMIHEGTLRHTKRLRDGWRDSRMYSMLRDEWESEGR